MTDYIQDLRNETTVIRDKVKRGMLPLIARVPALDAATRGYALAQSDHYGGMRDIAVFNGRSANNVPIPFRNSDLLHSCADLIMHEELTWSHPDKMSIIEYPVMSDRNEQSYFDKYSPNSDLQYGDRQHNGRRKTSFTDDFGAPQVRNHRMADTFDPTIEAIGEHSDLYDALDNSGLTGRQREAVDLVYFGNEGEGMTQEDAATIMGIRKPNVNAYLNVSLRKLREYMSDE